MCLIPAYLFFWRVALASVLPCEGGNQPFHGQGGEEVGGEKWSKGRLINTHKLSLRVPSTIQQD